MDAKKCIRISVHLKTKFFPQTQICIWGVLDNSLPVDDSWSWYGDPTSVCDQSGQAAWQHYWQLFWQHWYWQPRQVFGLLLDWNFVGFCQHNLKYIFFNSLLRNPAFYTTFPFTAAFVLVMVTKFNHISVYVTSFWAGIGSMQGAILSYCIGLPMAILSNPEMLSKSVSSLIL